MRGILQMENVRWRMGECCLVVYDESYRQKVTGKSNGQRVMH